MKIKYFYQLVVLLTCLQYSYSQVFITEVMFDPAVNEYYGEFVEIWNNGSQAVDLTGFKIGDGTGVDDIISAGQGLSLPAHRFGIILDPDYFDNGQPYSLLIPDSALMLTITSSAIGSAGLKNSASETVILFDAQNDTVNAYEYSIGNNRGHSDEKIILDGPNISSNWADSQVLNGTPGFTNSVSPYQYNLKASSLIASSPAPVAGDIISLCAEIYNTGADTVQSFSVGFFLDLQNDSTLDTTDLFNMIELPALAPGAITQISSQTGPLSAGYSLFGVEILPPDDNPADNKALLRLYCSSIENAIVFNEIMYKPASGQCEWIELYNSSDDTIDLAGWTFSDSDTTEKKLLTGEMLPQNYYLLSGDSAVFQCDIPAEVLVNILPSWNALNNDGDTLWLFDPAGITQVFFPYPPNWLNLEPGKSAERVNSAVNQWFPSVDPSGGTPGKINSVNFTASSVSGVELSLDPKLFTPDGDSIDDFTVVRYKLQVPYASVSVRIFDLQGRLIRKLTLDSPSGPQGEITWDGKWDDGRIGRAGAYIVHLEAIAETFKAKYEARSVVYLGCKL